MIIRKYMYRLGLTRFDLLAFLFYGSFLLFTLPSLKYIGYICAFAALIYMVVFEFRALMYKDLESLEPNLSELKRRNNIIDALGVITFIIVSAIYGLQSLLGAICIITALVTIRANVFIMMAFFVSITILIVNFFHFDLVLFIDYPHQFFDMYHSYGLSFAIDKFIINSNHPNIGQLYILVPYILFMLGLVIEHGRNYNKMLTIKSSKQATELNTDDAISFGYEITTGKEIQITHKELNTHMYINGASGSGKTVAMLNFVIEAAMKKIPLIYIDGKGATDLEERISTIARNHGRTFRIFTLSPDSVAEASAYDFLGSGTFTEKKNRIMQLFIQADGAGTSYYQDNLETFINRVFMVIYQQGLKIDLYRFLVLITNINDLVEFAKKDVVLDDGSVVNWQRYFEEIRDMKPENSPRTRIITKLDPFIHSSYGHLFNVIAKDNVISLRQSIRNGEIVLFLLDASAFSLDTQRVAKMVISDINATFSELGKLKTPLKTFCCFDEFKNYETDAISKTISLHRSNGMHAIIGTQSLALIDREIGNGILTNCQTHLIMASADEDAMRFSEEFGKMDKMDTTTRIRDDKVSELVTKTIRAYKIDKQDIKDIVVNTGQGYLHRKAVGAKPVKIQVKQN
jgi:hypothetical protein